MPQDAKANSPPPRLRASHNPHPPRAPSVFHPSSRPPGASHFFFPHFFFPLFCLALTPPSGAFCGRMDARVGSTTGQLKPHGIDTTETEYQQSNSFLHGSRLIRILETFRRRHVQAGTRDARGPLSVFLQRPSRCRNQRHGKRPFHVLQRKAGRNGQNMKTYNLTENLFWTAALAILAGGGAVQTKRRNRMLWAVVCLA